MTDDISDGGVTPSNASHWIAPPLVPGEWQEMTGGEALSFVSRMERSENRFSRYYTGDYDIECVRYLPVTFYPDFVLVEVQVFLIGPEKPAIATILYGPLGMFPIIGRSSLLHMLNGSGLLQVEDVAMATDYCRFFCSAVWSELGRFELVDKPEDLVWERSSEHRDKIDTALASGLPPMTETEPGTFEQASYVRYGNNVFRSNFRLKKDGNVDMYDDEPIEEGLPIGVETLTGPFRIPPAAPSGEMEVRP